MGKSIQKILEEFATNFAEKDEEGNWWGHDTNLGDRHSAFTKARNQISIRRPIQHEMKSKRVLSGVKRRDKLAQAIWGKNIPLWWKGSTAEYQILEKVKWLQDRKPAQEGNKT